jgi:hypothetical protein
MYKLIPVLFLICVISLPAGVTINVQEAGADVSVEASGTLDTSGLNLAYSNTAGAAWNVYPQSGGFRAGAPSTLDLYDGVTSPGGSFGSGSFATASTRIGDSIYVSAGYIGLPVDYVSGATLTASNVFTGASFSSLGLSPGSYTWAWSSDSITLNIGASAVPEPSTYAALAGLAIFGVVLLRRRR